MDKKEHELRIQHMSGVITPEQNLEEPINTTPFGFRTEYNDQFRSRRRIVGIDTSNNGACLEKKMLDIVVSKRKNDDNYKNFISTINNNDSNHVKSPNDSNYFKNHYSRCSEYRDRYRTASEQKTSYMSSNIDNQAHDSHNINNNNIIIGNYGYRIRNPFMTEYKDKYKQKIATHAFNRDLDKAISAEAQKKWLNNYQSNKNNSDMKGQHYKKTNANNNHNSECNKLNKSSISCIDGDTCCNDNDMCTTLHKNGHSHIANICHNKGTNNDSNNSCCNYSLDKLDLCSYSNKRGPSTLTILKPAQHMSNPPLINKNNNSVNSYYSANNSHHCNNNHSIHCINNSDNNNSCSDNIDDNCKKNTVCRTTCADKINNKNNICQSKCNATCNNVHDNNNKNDNNWKISSDRMDPFFSSKKAISTPSYHYLSALPYTCKNRSVKTGTCNNNSMINNNIDISRGHYVAKCNDLTFRTTYGCNYNDLNSIRNKFSIQLNSRFVKNRNQDKNGNYFHYYGYKNYLDEKNGDDNDTNNNNCNAIISCCENDNNDQCHDKNHNKNIIDNTKTCCNNINNDNTINYFCNNQNSVNKCNAKICSNDKRDDTASVNCCVTDDTRPTANHYNSGDTNEDFFDYYRKNCIDNSVYTEARNVNPVRGYSDKKIYKLPGPQRLYCEDDPEEKLESETETSSSFTLKKRQMPILSYDASEYALLKQKQNDSKNHNNDDKCCHGNNNECCTLKNRNENDYCNQNNSYGCTINDKCCENKKKTNNCCDDTHDCCFNNNDCCNKNSNCNNCTNNNTTTVNIKCNSDMRSDSCCNNKKHDESTENKRSDYALLKEKNHVYDRAKGLVDIRNDNLSFSKKELEYEYEKEKNSLERKLAIEKLQTRMRPNLIEQYLRETNNNAITITNNINNMHKYDNYYDQDHKHNHNYHVCGYENNNNSNDGCSKNHCNNYSDNNNNVKMCGDNATNPEHCNHTNNNSECCDNSDECCNNAKINHHNNTSCSDIHNKDCCNTIYNNERCNTKNDNECCNLNYNNECCNTKNDNECCNTKSDNECCNTIYNKDCCNTKNDNECCNTIYNKDCCNTKNDNECCNTSYNNECCNTKNDNECCNTIYNKDRCNTKNDNECCNTKNDNECCNTNYNKDCCNTSYNKDCCNTNYNNECCNTKNDNECCNTNYNKDYCNTNYNKDCCNTKNDNECCNNNAKNNHNKNTYCSDINNKDCCNANNNNKCCNISDDNECCNNNNAINNEHCNDYNLGNSNPTCSVYSKSDYDRIYYNYLNERNKKMAGYNRFDESLYKFKPFRKFIDNADSRSYACDKNTIKINNIHNNNNTNIDTNKNKINNNKTNILKSMNVMEVDFIPKSALMQESRAAGLERKGIHPIDYRATIQG